MATKNELSALALRGEINANHRECLKTANDAIDYGLKAGELLHKVKDMLPHGSFEKWVKQYCDFSYDVASGYMRLHKELLTYSKVERAQLLADATSVTNLKKLLKPAENSKSIPLLEDSTHPTSGETGSGVLDAESEPDPDHDHGYTPTHKDLGKCPNCAGTKWDEDEDGFSCAKCRHPHGEPAGDVDEGRSGKSPKRDSGPVVAKTGREHDLFEAKQVIKTWADAVGRWMSGHPSIDDYRDKFPGPLGDAVIEATKRLWESLEAWKRGIK